MIVPLSALELDTVHDRRQDARAMLSHFITLRLFNDGLKLNVFKIQNLLDFYGFFKVKFNKISVN